jgi:hypothetical protein
LARVVPSRMAQRLRSTRVLIMEQAMANQGKEVKSENVEYTRRAITIGRSPEDVAAFWREHGGDDPESLTEQVRFVRAPGDRGTEIHLARTYERPGPIAKVVATFKHDNPSQREFDELFALKQILETGDTVTSDAWANGSAKPRPAQPIGEPAEARP